MNNISYALIQEQLAASDTFKIQLGRSLKLYGKSEGGAIIKGHFRYGECEDFRSPNDAKVFLMENPLSMIKRDLDKIPNLNMIYKLSKKDAKAFLQQHFRSIHSDGIFNFGLDDCDFTISGLEGTVYLHTSQHHDSVPYSVNFGNRTVHHSYMTKNEFFRGGSKK